jgi:hypothetical protein
MTLRLTPRKKGAFVLANLALGATYFIGGGSSGPGRTAYSVLDPLLTQQAAAHGCNENECISGQWCQPGHPGRDCHQSASGPDCSASDCPP